MSVGIESSEKIYFQPSCRLELNCWKNHFHRKNVVRNKLISDNFRRSQFVGIIEFKHNFPTTVGANPMVTFCRKCTLIPRTCQKYLFSNFRRHILVGKTYFRPKSLCFRLLLAVGKDSLCCSAHNQCNRHNKIPLLHVEQFYSIPTTFEKAQSDNQLYHCLTVFYMVD